MTATSPVWATLNQSGGPHLDSLKHDYVPEGLLDMMPGTPRVVLDVGCFCGAVGAKLKAKYPEVRVVGVEPLVDAAKLAGQKLDQVLTGKLEEINLEDAGITPGSVDTIILADVLEHMYDPWQALVSLRPTLASGGVILASIPNVRNLTVINDLVQGDFPYAPAGILDITHIRFFTWQGVQRLFAETGYRIEHANFNIDPRCQFLLDGLKQSQPANIDIPAMLIRNMNHLQLRELATLQFWVRAVPA
ncbi:MAG: methyltransferase domain-containing protein [Sulfuricella sp.]|nr:methyltransferase domain-containing protein [Sulfuricella sp.]